MNKIIWISAAVLSVAACAKNEVVPVNSGENQEITFNVAPKTKADLDEHEHTEFGKDNVFASWAYYLPGTVKWDKKDGDNTTDPITPATTPALYIDGAVIANTKPNGADGVWKAKDKTYYWPKNGSLTFFAYSLNKGDLTLAASTGFTCTIGAGITGHIDLKENSNTDFLVAEIAKDMKSNDNGDKAHFTNGVPTLFKHRLSSVAFAIKTWEHYTNKEFKLTNITFHNLSHYGTYGQLPTESFVAGETKYDPVFTKAPQEIPYQTNFVGVTGVDKYIFIPQTFADDATIDVVYTITTKVPKSDDVVETVTKPIKLNTLFPTEHNDSTDPKKVTGGGWEMGKKYTIYLTFTLDEILWDPAVQDWEDVNIGTDTKPIIVG